MGVTSVMGVGSGGGVAPLLADEMTFKAMSLSAAQLLVLSKG